MRLQAMPISADRPGRLHHPPAKLHLAARHAAHLLRYAVLPALLGLAIVLRPGVATADLYKWQSPDGVWHYSNTNPAAVESTALVAEEAIEPHVAHEDLARGTNLGRSGAMLRVAQKIDTRRTSRLPLALPPEQRPARIGDGLSILVHIDATRASRPVKINPAGFKLKDRHGYTYDNRYETEPHLQMQTVNPGEILRGWLSFQVLDPAEDFSSVLLRYDYPVDPSEWGRP